MKRVEPQSDEIEAEVRENTEFLMKSVLYRYRSVSSDALLRRECEALKSGYLYWNSPLDFNDPFDCVPAFVFEGSSIDRKRRLKKSFETTQFDGNRAARRREITRALKIPREAVVGAMSASTLNDLKRFGMCCFTTQPDNILMWSHYASNHTGICLGFKPSPENLDLLSALPVRYREERPSYNMMDSMIEQDVFQALVTKSDQWEYEKEWRVIDRRIQNRRRRYPLSSLTEVIFGCRIGGGDREAVIAAVKSSGSTPTFFECRIDSLHYRLNVEPLS